MYEGICFIDSVLYTTLISRVLDHEGNKLMIEAVHSSIQVSKDMLDDGYLECQCFAHYGSETLESEIAQIEETCKFIDNENQNLT